MTVFLCIVYVLMLTQFAIILIFQGFGKPNVYHATIVIFLEFFFFFLLTSPMLTVSPNIFDF